MRKLSIGRAILVLLALAFLLLLSACELPKIGPFAPKGAPAATSVAGQSTTPSATDASATNAPTQPSLSADGMTEISAKDFADPSTELHDLIIFSSTEPQAFPGLQIGATNLSYAEKQLWALSPDRKRAGRLSPEGFGTEILFPESAAKKVRLVEYGLGFTNERIEAVTVPEACSRSADSAFDAANPPCGGFELSPDGRYLAYYSGADSCGREMTVSDLRTSQPVRSFPGVRWMTFLSDSSIVMANGGCDNGKIATYLPSKDRYVTIDSDGKRIWSPDKNTLLIQTDGKPVFRTGLWGISQDRIFLWNESHDVILDSISWTPDENIFLFNHRKATYDQISKTMLLQGPRQIVWMNAKTRSQRQLAYEPGYDYHLCGENGEPCDQWYGDWIKVMRTRYHQVAIKVDPTTGKPDVNKAEVRCALYGKDCAEPGEEFALNWKTGAIQAWDPAVLPVTEPTSAFPSAPLPDQTKDPVYSDPNGAFAFYTSADGHSLWYVPASGGTPTLWVQNGENFTYLP